MVEVFPEVLRLICQFQSSFAQSHRNMILTGMDGARGFKAKYYILDKKRSSSCHFTVLCHDAEMAIDSGEE